MLDKPLIEQPEPREGLKCEECGLVYENEEDWESVDETGLCRECNN